MKKVLIIGAGIAGLTCAIETAKSGDLAILAAPCGPERAQSVMAAGGISAVDAATGDSVQQHIQDTLEGGCHLAGPEAVRGLCEAAPDILEWLTGLGVLFDRRPDGTPERRAFGGQSRARAAYSGASTGKHIVTALVQEARKYECAGLVEYRLFRRFHSALIRDGVCYGALLYHEVSRKFETVTADAVVMATGGYGMMFGKATGSVLSDGYAVGRLFRQGALLKDLEFVQYHPTAIETVNKRMLVTEAARGEGGRLYYLDGERRVYFMEDRYGAQGNLMPRDVVSACMAEAPSQVYLDVSFLDRKTVTGKLAEACEICQTYLGIDITKDSIPVAPAPHFCMGGLAVDRFHRTNLKHLYAVGECASRYHGANRLGGNSLMAAIYSGRTAARAIREEACGEPAPSFDAYVAEQEKTVKPDGGSRFPAVYMEKNLMTVMNEQLGICRNEERLRAGIDSLDYYLDVSRKIHYDTGVSLYENYRLPTMMVLGRAILISAEARRETRGAHRRSDFPQTDPALAKSSLIGYHERNYDVSYAKEDDLCW